VFVDKITQANLHFHEASLLNIFSHTSLLGSASVRSTVQVRMAVVPAIALTFSGDESNSLSKSLEVPYLTTDNATENN
jgi:hypothetical protein